MGWEQIEEMSSKAQRKSVYWLASDHEVVANLTKSEAAEILTLLFEAKNRSEGKIYEKQAALLERVALWNEEE